MQRIFQKTALRRLVLRAAAALILIIALCVTSAAPIMANTVAANVIDGLDSYTFSMRSASLREILEQAEEEGMPPLGPLDIAERVKNTTTVYVSRGVEMTVNEAGQVSVLVAYKGETVEKALARNNFLLKEHDGVIPARNTEIDGPLSVEIDRSCTVTVSADEKVTEVSLVGATVEDALQAAGVTLRSVDSVNYSLTEPLFEKMIIRVSRTAMLTITADGKSTNYMVSASTVEEALRKCGIPFSDQDVLSCGRREKPKDGMHIIVHRAEVKEVTVTEDIPFKTIYEDSEDLPAGETQVKTEGVNGSKEVVYRVVVVDGKEQSKQIIREELLEEPVDQVILQSAGDEDREDQYVIEETEGGFFTDYDGVQISYAQLIVGTCTAYSEPDGITSLGQKPGYGTIAVDPDVIPYGTRLYITSPDGSIVYGYGIAGDTGGACLAGDIIADLHYGSEEECTAFGRRPMNVYILN